MDEGAVAVLSAIPSCCPPAGTSPSPSSKDCWLPPGSQRFIVNFFVVVVDFANFADNSRFCSFRETAN